MNENQPAKRLGSIVSGREKPDDEFRIFKTSGYFFAMNTFCLFMHDFFVVVPACLPMESPQQQAQRNERKTRGL